MSIYVLGGIIIGVLIPIALFLFIFVLGFGIAGIQAGSLAACCQPPSVVAKGCFSTLQKFGATAKFLIIIPKVALIGAIAGLIYFLACKIFQWQI